MMRKTIIFVMMSILLLGLVYAVPSDEKVIQKERLKAIADDMPPRNGTPMPYENETRMQKRIMVGEEIRLMDGKTLKIEGNDTRIRLRTGEHVAECEEDCNLTQEQDRIRATLSNGRNAEIKIMPDTASERALERLRLKLCENCTLQLKEVGEGNKTRLAYEINATKRARVLGIFRARMNVEAQVDAETGEIIKARRPWWSFIASESDEAVPQEE